MNFDEIKKMSKQEKDGKSPRKLCNMCKNCYTDMLDHLGISDIKD